MIGTYRERWTAVGGAEDVPLFGFPHGVGLEPASVNVERMIGIFRQGVSDLREVWQKALPEDTLAEVVAVAEAESRPFHFPDPTWVRVVYDFAVAYERRVLPPEQLLGSMVPLYLGRTASFVIQTAESGPDQVEAVVKGLADEYLRHKGYLVRRWGHEPGGAPCGSS